ncbi:replication protein A 70 kDa DNA-binding subunit B-like [Forsythia ovata]|uniref:Replication protein A 70 kDa DNA-binding subunit B-like n=1 Tax=Forsythia ovata TaxID=205694 RepID=A0ABD1P4M1_9LAMI
MSKEFQLIRNVSSGSSGWTVKVVVAEKFSLRIAQKSPTKYQILIFMDTEGSTVQSPLYGQNITAFQDQLTLGNTYLISNAMVKITNSEYKAKSGEVQWIISGRTRIRKVEENNSNLIISTYTFTDFEDFPNYMDSNIDISNVAGMIIDIKPRMIIQTRYGKECQLSSKLCIPTDEKDFTEIKNIQGLKTVILGNQQQGCRKSRQPTVVAEKFRQPIEVA